MADEKDDPAALSSSPPGTSSFNSRFLSSAYNYVGGSDSGFMDFTLAPNARKSNIFDERVPLATPNARKSIMFDERGQSSSPSSPSYVSSSSFSLLSSRFTDDKYITPSAVGYEEYKEFIESSRKVEEAFENVLGKNDNLFGEPLPPPSDRYDIITIDKYDCDVIKFSKN